jgi:ribosome-binding protein aMBF1 (putative translation factor)
MSPETPVLVQIERIEKMEADISREREVMARTLLEARTKAGLSLRDVAPVVKLTAAALNNIERGRAWRTVTVKRIARFYSKLAA